MKVGYIFLNCSCSALHHNPTCPPLILRGGTYDGDDGKTVAGVRALRSPSSGKRGAGGVTNSGGCIFISSCRRGGPVWPPASPRVRATTWGCPYEGTLFKYKTPERQSRWITEKHSQTWRFF